MCSESRVGRPSTSRSGAVPGNADARCAARAPLEPDGAAPRPHVAEVGPPTSPSTALRGRVRHIRETIAQACARAGRRPEQVTLVAVTKTVPPAAVLEAARAGLRDFGENYVQEASPKRAELTGQLPADARWHLIGHLQANKVKASLVLFDIIHTVDSLRLAEAISQRAAARTVPVLLEVALGDQPERLGFRADALDSAVTTMRDLPGLAIQGLMTVAPLGIPLGEARRIFRRLRELQEQLASRFPDLEWQQLSMGMTDDYEVAIEEGATMVRIGRAVFGERPPKV